MVRIFYDVKVELIGQSLWLSESKKGILKLGGYECFGRAPPPAGDFEASIKRHN